MQELAPPVVTGKEDRFHHIITDACTGCGVCAAQCPTQAIGTKDGRCAIDPQKCIDCGTCAAVCPAGAARPVPGVRASISIEDIERSLVYFNPGCALNLYRKDVAQRMLRLLQDSFGDVKLHDVCCRHPPRVPEGSTIINNCGGCDRRFRSLYPGIRTISCWEVLDSIEGLKLPDYGGMRMSVHDSCGYRHKPQVHRAIRSLLCKMNIAVAEAKFHGTESVCCGDNLYGHVPNERVLQRIRMRADQFPCDDVVVYCIGCERGLGEAGKTTHYLPDLLVGRLGDKNTDTLDGYHQKLGDYVRAH